MDKHKEVVLLDALAQLVHGLSSDEITRLFERILRERGQPGLPISAFRAPLSGLEIIVKYLREVEHRSFAEISLLLGRSRSTVYNTYTATKKKYSALLDISNVSIKIPFTIVENRTFSVLESIVSYLKDNQHLSLQQIALLLHRNYNTVKTVHRRYQRKKNAQNH